LCQVPPNTIISIEPLLGGFMAKIYMLKNSILKVCKFNTLSCLKKADGFGIWIPALLHHRITFQNFNRINPPPTPLGALWAEDWYICVNQMKATQECGGEIQRNKQRKKQERQQTCNATLWNVRVRIIAVEKQQYILRLLTPLLTILKNWVCSTMLLGRIYVADSNKCSYVFMWSSRCSVEIK